jgi:inner membrane protein
VASAFTHAIAAAGLATAAVPGRLPLRLVLAAAVCSVLPDADVLGFRFGVDYGDLLGHRGLSHSLLFAAALASGVTFALFRDPAWRDLRLRVAVVLFVATASHGVFDAMTNGGLGIAFFSPFDETRYFFPLRPVEVSPIGVRAFVSERSLAVLWSELVWILLPCAALTLPLGAWLRRRGRPAHGDCAKIRSG